ncbi:pentapeptide repeat-containing protein [Streptomyces sp. NPDC048338]|uniref:pentapeptide repeat-containing protein n=1 Tax=Streptomyces sp. NPDC048338 TaxID=3365536 RepID=UPI00371D3F16
MTSQIPRRRQAERRGLRLWNVGLVLALAFTAAVLTAGFVFYAGWDLLGARQLQKQPKLDSKTLFDLVKLSFGVVAGAGALVALVVAYRRQRVDEDGALRDATRLHTERFTTAVSQLGDDSAAVRLGGVHALAGLADDAPTRELRQTCVDVLCAYLRLPYTAEADLPAGDTSAHHAYLSLREVRHTVIRLVRDHLRLPSEHPHSWRGLHLDFTGVVFDGGDFSRAVFSSGTVDFTGAKFSSGRVDFIGAEFSGGMVDFTKAVFCGTKVDFYGAEFSGCVVNFSGAEFSGSMVNFSGAKFSAGGVGFTTAVFSRGMVNFSKAEFSGTPVSFIEAEFSGGTVAFTEAKFCAGTVAFSKAKFSAGTVSFTRAGYSGGTVNFTEAEFSGGTVSFIEAEFSGGSVDFTAANFSGGTVILAKAHFSGATVAFIDAHFSGGTVDFTRAQFVQGTVDFGSPEFSGGTVDFTLANFSGGTIDYNSAIFSGGAVDFTLASGMCPACISLSSPMPGLTLSDPWRLPA